LDVSIRTLIISDKHAMMVQISASFLFVAGLVISGLATPSRRPIDQLEQDIAALASQVTTLDLFLKVGVTTAELLVNNLNDHSPLAEYC
jgi:hypothetical protein